MRQRPVDETRDGSDREYWPARHLIAHECVHTGQYERSGSVAGFLRAYFSECLEIGYPDAAMEQEAVMRSADLKA